MRFYDLKEQLTEWNKGPNITDADMKNASGIGDVIHAVNTKQIQKGLPHFLVPQVEEAVKKDPAIIERVYEKSQIR